MWFDHYIVNKCDLIQHILHFLCRFYIKCTACLSEISFRTDPANTDYILEAGATRNFEALSKAEKQAEAEANAHKVKAFNIERYQIKQLNSLKAKTR